MEIIVEEITEKGKVGKVIAHYHNVDKNSIGISENDKLLFRYTNLVYKSNETPVPEYYNVDYEYFHALEHSEGITINLKKNILIHFREI